MKILLYILLGSVIIANNDYKKKHEYITTHFENGGGNVKLYVIDNANDTFIIKPFFYEDMQFKKIEIIFEHKFDL